MEKSSIVRIDFACAGCLVIALALGCGEQAPFTKAPVDEVVKARATQWPPYRAPKVVDLAIIAGDRPMIDRTDTKPDQPAPSWMVIPHEDWDLSTTAADSLGRIGQPAVPALVRALREPDPKIRLRAVRILGRIGPDAEDAVDDLVHVLSDPQLAVRKAAVRALGQIGPAAGEAVEPLLQVLDETPSRRGSVIQTTSAEE